MREYITRDPDATGPKGLRLHTGSCPATAHFLVRAVGADGKEKMRLHRRVRLLAPTWEEAFAALTYQLADPQQRLRWEPGDQHFSADGVYFYFSDIDADDTQLIEALQASGYSLDPLYDDAEVVMSVRQAFRRLGRGSDESDMDVVLVDLPFSE